MTSESRDIDMKIVPSVPGTRLPTYMFFHVAIMLCISLLVMALANWRAVNELIVSIITFGGKFWPPQLSRHLQRPFLSLNRLPKAIRRILLAASPSVHWPYALLEPVEHGWSNPISQAASWSGGPWWRL